MWLIDKLFNRKIEGKSSLDHLESLKPLEEEVENLKDISDKISVNEDTVGVSGNIYSSGDASIGGDITANGDASIGGDITANGDASIVGDITANGDASIVGDVEVGSIKSSNVIQLNATAFDETKFEVVEATCEVINEKARIYRIVVNVLEDITGTYLNLQGLLPSGSARPSKTWVGKYLPDNTANTTADVKFNVGGDVYLYSITLLKANKQAEIVVLSLW